MNDYKNLLIAYSSSVSSVFAAVETRTLITIVSAIILPVIFFAIGKTIDVMLQVHLEEKRAARREHQADGGAR